MKAVKWSHYLSYIEVLFVLWYEMDIIFLILQSILYIVHVCEFLLTCEYRPSCYKYGYACYATHFNFIEHLQ